MRILPLIAVAAFAANAQAQAPEAIMDRAVSRFNAMKTLRAEFRQRITNPLTGTTATSTGVMLRRQPNLLAINFTDPAGDRVISDGTTLWVYLPSSAPGQVMKLAPRTGGAANIDPGNIFLSSPRTRYRMTLAGTEPVNGRRANVIVLTPRTNNQTFTRAKVWVDAADATIRQFEVVDANGLNRLVTITRLSPNAHVNASAFRFTPPRGVRIVDSSTLPAM